MSVQKNVVIFESKPEQLIDKFRSYVPQSKGSYKVAVFCVVDPFSIDFSFTLMDQLANLGFSFLIPYTFSLNSRLDYKFYQKEQLRWILLLVFILTLAIIVMP